MSEASESPEEQARCVGFMVKIQPEDDAEVACMNALSQVVRHFSDWFIPPLDQKAMPRIAAWFADRHGRQDGSALP